MESEKRYIETQKIRYENANCVKLEEWKSNNSGVLLS